MEIKKTRQRNGIFESTPLTGLRAIRSLEATTTIRETEVILRIVGSLFLRLSALPLGKLPVATESI